MSDKKKALLKLLLLGIILLLIPIILYFTYRNTLFNTEYLRNDLITHLSAHKYIAVLALIILQAIQVIICILPGQPIQFAASYLFGIYIGYAISIIGAILGAFIAFYLAKWLGRDAVKMIFGEDKVENYRHKINSGKGLSIVLLIYLIPGFPKDLVGYVAGISKMRLLPFLVISSIGRTPGMLGSLFVGYYYQDKNWTAIIILSIICLIILAICLIKRKDVLDYMDKIESRDIEREEKHRGKKD